MMGKDTLIEKALKVPIKTRFNDLYNERFGHLPDNERPSYVDLAKDIGVNRATVSNWMRGYVDRTDFETLGKFCKYFDIEVGELIVFEPEDDQ